MTFAVITGDGKRDVDIASEMVERVKDVIYEYSERTNIITAIGVLEIAKAEILADNIDGGD